MPITRIFWRRTSNQDIHVLRGQTSRNLTAGDLRFIDDNTPNASSVSAKSYLAANNDVVLTLNPLFKGAAAGNLFSGLDIDVKLDTGEVSPHAAAAKNNFIIEVTATDATPAHKVISSETIRVHVHGSVTRLVLTPTTLTVRPAASTRTDSEETDYQFTLRALFDDGAIGDLTENHDVSWSSSPPDRIDSDTGKLSIDPADTEGDTITITATLPPELGGGSATATMRIGKAWRDDPDIPTTTIVVGGGWPGTTLPDYAPNVLFLSDGFTVTDEPSFEKAVITMVHHLKTDRLVRPYDLLCTSMNFWRAYLPAGARGISFRCEIFTDPPQPDGSAVGQVVPAPEKPPDTGKWKIGHLIYRVGLPVPADSGKTVGQLRTTVWPSQINEAIPAAPVLKDSVIAHWLRIARRTFIEELDNFPGMAVGDPPAANTDPGTPDIALHPNRVGRDGLNGFLGLLQSFSGVQFGPGLNLGTVWAVPGRKDDTDYAVGDFIMVTDNPGRVFTCTTAGNSDSSEPADYASAEDGATVVDGTATFRAVPMWFDNSGLVVVLSSYPGGRPNHVTRTRSRTPYVAMGMDDGMDDIPLGPPSSGGLGFSLNVQQVLPDVSVQTSRGLAHELGHWFALGDEYVDFDREYPLGVDSLADSLNLQAEADAQTAGKIDGAQIRWNWHRIRKAAVIAGAPTNVDATTFRIPVILGQGLQFAAGDTVLLRLRRPGGLLAKAVTVQPGGPLVVVAKTKNTVDVQAAPGVNVTLAGLTAFKPGSILFLPVKAPASVFETNYPFAEMVAKNVKDLITKNHDVLFHQATGAARTPEIKADRDIQHPDLDGLTPELPTFFCTKDTPRIVGLYEGGAQYANGVFHPTGTCVMRNSDVGSNQFCAVCRYIMVDFVNPFRHFEIDLDYDKIYPLK